MGLSYLSSINGNVMVGLSYWREAFILFPWYLEVILMLHVPLFFFCRRVCGRQHFQWELRYIVLKNLTSNIWSYCLCWEFSLFFVLMFVKLWWQWDKLDAVYEFNWDFKNLEVSCFMFGLHSPVLLCIVESTSLTGLMRFWYLCFFICISGSVGGRWFAPREESLCFWVHRT